MLTLTIPTMLAVVATGPMVSSTAVSTHPVRANVARTQPMIDRADSSKYALLLNVVPGHSVPAAVDVFKSTFAGFPASLTGGHNPHPITLQQAVYGGPSGERMYVPNPFTMVAWDTMNSPFYSWITDFGIPSASLQKQLTDAQTTVSNLQSLIRSLQNQLRLPKGDDVKPNQNVGALKARLAQAGADLSVAQANLNKLTATVPQKLKTYGFLSDACIANAGGESTVFDTIRLSHPQIAELDLPALSKGSQVATGMTVTLVSDMVHLTNADLHNVAQALTVDATQNHRGPWLPNMKPWSQSKFTFSVPGFDTSTITDISSMMLLPNALIPSGKTERKGAYFVTLRKDRIQGLKMPTLLASKLAAANPTSATLTIMHSDGTSFVDVTFVNPRMRALVPGSPTPISDKLPPLTGAPPITAPTGAAQQVVSQLQGAGGTPPPVGALTPPPTSTNPALNVMVQVSLTCDSVELHFH